MCDIQHYKKIFDRYGGMMRTTQLAQEKVFYAQRRQLILDGYIEKIRRGYYQWIDPDDFSETGLITRLFPDAILCIDTALRYYGYSDRTPGQWHLAVSKDSGKSRFHINLRKTLSQIEKALPPEGVQDLSKLQKAMVLIEITTPRGTDNPRIWDTSNRAINLIINNLKGIFFRDDDFEHMAFCVVANWGDIGRATIRICELSQWEKHPNLSKNDEIL